MQNTTLLTTWQDGDFTTKVEAVNGQIRISESHGGDYHLREVIELEQAVNLAKAIVEFAEATASQPDDEMQGSFYRLHDDDFAPYEGISAHWGHD